MTFNTGDTVLYSKDDSSSCLAIIFKKDTSLANTTYIIKDIETNNTITEVLENSLDICPPNILVDFFWNQITYTGNNGDISKYIVNHILKNVGNSSQIVWGPNDTNTEYKLTMKDYEPWVKQKV
tara:strand:+ start:67 stop:438 length:372 start_codon:yes stop_codon:yes gene_type:complete